jgi:hypothetical protein
MSNAAKTLGSALRELFADHEHDGWWRLAEVDGNTLYPSGDGYSVSLMAYWHCCPRCYQTTKRMLGAQVACSCGVMSPGKYRRVELHVPATWARGAERTMFGRITQAIRGVLSAHPAEFAEEVTRIDLATWGQP